MNSEKRAVKIIANIVLLIVTAIMLIPILMVVNIALKTPEEFLKYPLTIVRSIRWQNFTDAWNQAEMYIYFKNSVLFTFTSVAGVIFFATIASYPISRKHLKKASDFVYMMFLSGLFMPSSLVSIIMVMKVLHFYNTYHGYIIYTMAGGMPMAIFILTGFIKGIPRELDEAAVIDGCGYIRFIVTIIIPLMKPAVATLGMLTAIGAWNDFINPYLFLTTRSMRPLTAGLYLFFGEYFTNWTLLSAGIIIVVLPLIILYAFVQRFIIAGVMNGAVKG